MRFTDVLVPALIGALMIHGVAAASANNAQLPAKPGPRDRCPVCGMFVAKYASWLAVVTLRDGSAVYFDGPKDMFRYYFDLERYDKKRKSADIGDLFVTDYYSTKLIRAEAAYFVRGSDVMGPMGHELVPLRSADEARTFSIDHKGAEVLSFEAVTAEVVSKLK